MFKYKDTTFKFSFMAFIILYICVCSPAFHSFLPLFFSANSLTFIHLSPSHSVLQSPGSEPIYLWL